jgi:hypothetical protein
MTRYGQKRQVNKADGHVRFTPDRVGLAAPAGSTTANGPRFICIVDA